MENKQTSTQGKLAYETPAIEVIELPSAPQMLAASQGASRPDYDSEEWE